MKNRGHHLVPRPLEPPFPGGSGRPVRTRRSALQGPCLPAGPPELLLRLGGEALAVHAGYLAHNEWTMQPGMVASRSRRAHRARRAADQSSQTRSWLSGSSIGDEMNRTCGASSNSPPWGVFAGITQTSPRFTGRVTPPTVTDPVPSST